jgi:hypothetical protein
MSKRTLTDSIQSGLSPFDVEDLVKLLCCHLFVPRLSQLENLAAEYEVEKEEKRRAHGLLMILRLSSTCHALRALLAPLCEPGRAIFAQFCRGARHFPQRFRCDGCDEESCFRCAGVACHNCARENCLYCQEDGEWRACRYCRRDFCEGCGADSDWFNDEKECCESCEALGYDDPDDEPGTGSAEADSVE